MVGAAAAEGGGAGRGGLSHVRCMNSSNWANCARRLATILLQTAPGAPGAAVSRVAPIRGPGRQPTAAGCSWREGTDTLADRHNAELSQPQARAQTARGQGPWSAGTTAAEQR